MSRTWGSVVCKLPTILPNIQEVSVKVSVASVIGGRLLDDDTLVIDVYPVWPEYPQTSRRKVAFCEEERPEGLGFNFCQPEIIEIGGRNLWVFLEEPCEQFR